jgi:putative membrane protein
MLFVIRGSVLPRILFQLILMALISTAITFSQGDLFGWKVGLNFVPFTLIGVALAIFLGFRNTASYDRYWEARKIWGSILNVTRSLTRQHLVWIKNKELNKIFVYRLIAFVHGLRHQLRGTNVARDVESLIDQELFIKLKNAHFRPNLILLSLGELLATSVESELIHPQLAANLDDSLNQLTADLGGCERIANTPIPFTYSVIIHRTVYIYCFLLPFALVSSIGVLTPLVVTFVAYTFLALDALNDELEDPFGSMPNDLPLESLSNGIEISLREMLGEIDLPKPIWPENFVLH